jgi:hypothetical protein
MSGFVTLGSAAFLGGIGTDTQITYTDGHYATLTSVIADLHYLGITQVRDGISNGAGGSAPVSSYISMAQAGIQFTFLLSSNDHSNADILAQLALFNQVEAAAPGSIIALEGPNEINNFPVTFDGSTGLAGALAMQAALYADVAADPTLAGVAVDYFTGYDAGTIALGPLLPAAGLANFDNQHPYPAGGQPPAFWVSRANALPNAASATTPAVYTETGYTTMQVNEYTQAVYTLDMLFDTAQQGISKTYLYQLLDAYAPGSPQGDSGYGLFDDTGAPKLAAEALHDLTTMIGSAGTGGGISSAISFSVAGLPATGNALELTGSAADMIVLWAEPSIWDAATGTNLIAPTEYVTLALPETYATLALFDPLSGTSATEIFTNTDHVTIALTDHPVLLEIPNAAPCFCTGTLIRTPRGDIPVQALAVGDLVETQAGPKRILWIGMKRYDPRQIEGNPLISPVGIKESAIAPGIPSRDLWVSPGHALCLDNALVPAWRLVNGVSVIQPVWVDCITYHHIELETHAILFSENCPSESFLDDECRLQFDDVADFFARHGHGPRSRTPCLPRLEAGFELYALRRRLMHRAGLEEAPVPRGELRGFVDIAGPGRLAGWAQNLAAPESPSCLDVLVEGRLLMQILANLYRADLRHAGIGSGCHGFDLLLPKGVQGRISICCSRTGVALPLTPAAASAA